jgi:SAM-dependent methyltransferase
LIADASRVPFRDGCADLVVAFMSLMDIDEWDAAIGEAARLLPAGGRFLLAIVHPVNSSGYFHGTDEDRPDDPFVIEGSYMTASRFEDTIERDGLTMTFAGEHRRLADYFAALRSHGFVIDDLREVTVEDPADRWYRIPMFLHISAVRR